MSYKGISKELEKNINDVVEFVSPRARKIDETNRMDASVLQKLFDQRLMGIFASERYGGIEKGFVEASIVSERLGKVSSGVAHMLFTHNVAAYALQVFGNEEQKEKYLPKLTSKVLGAIAITEATGGSDIAHSVRLKAEKKGMVYILNGSKTLITNAALGDIFIVICRTGSGGKGLTGLIVEEERGVEIANLDLSVMRGSGVGTVKFKNVEVPLENVIASEGKGMRVALGALAPNRIPFAAMGIGIAQSCLEIAISRAKKREAFGANLADFQAIQFMLAELAVEIETTKRFIYYAAEVADANISEASTLGAMAKLKSAQVAKKAADLAVQIYGGYGLISDTRVNRAYRDAKALDIAEGTSEMMKLIISRTLLA